jgi:uncharacterized protein (TIGR03086 family)
VENFGLSRRRSGQLTEQVFEGLGDTPSDRGAGRGLPLHGPVVHDVVMSTRLHEAVRPACEAVAAALGDVASPGADLAAATPCAQLDLRALVEHFVGTTGAMARLGLDEPLDPENPWGGGEGSADADWAARLIGNLEVIGRGWGRPGAWSGDVVVGGSAMARPMLGEMALVEVTAHGWDVVRTLGGTLELPPEAADAVLLAASGTAELGRRMGAYGPEVPVADDASALDRALGQLGRDPGWSA